MGVAPLDTNEILNRFRHLEPRQKLELLELLWDDLASDPDQIPLSDAQRKLLDERLRQHKESPDEVHDWDDVKSEAEKRLR